MNDTTGPSSKKLPMRPVIVALPDNLREKAVKIGCGNMSLGIRMAVGKYRMPAEPRPGDLE